MENNIDIMEVDYDSEIEKNYGESLEKVKNSSDRRKYSKKTLAEALDDIKSKKLTIYDAAKKYSIPSTTLYHRLRN
jgi:transposase-like protein